MLKEGSGGPFNHHYIGLARHQHQTTFEKYTISPANRHTSTFNISYYNLFYIQYVYIYKYIERENMYFPLLVHHVPSYTSWYHLLHPGEVFNLVANRSSFQTPHFVDPQETVIWAASQVERWFSGYRLSDAIVIRPWNSREFQWTTCWDSPAAWFPQRHW